MHLKTFTYIVTITKNHLFPLLPHLLPSFLFSSLLSQKPNRSSLKSHNFSFFSSSTSLSISLKQRMKRRTSFGIVDTINEEEEDYMDHSSSFSSSSSSLSPSLQPRICLSSPSMELESRVNKWSLVHNSKPDVLVHVGGTRFHLHKEPLSRNSGYLKRHLTDVNELTLSPPLNITAETFSLVTAFCYGARIELTPFNIVSLRVAVELLLLTGGNNVRDNLRNLTESYLRRVVFVNADYISIVLRSCLNSLPEAETTAFLVGRCIEALTEIGDGDCVNEFLEQAVILPAGYFIAVANAVQQHFPRHDLLYRVVDAYIKERDGEITEEEKLQICNSIDCERLSPPLLLHAVQNPKMPLRFIVRAMLQEQNNTRRSIIAAADSATTLESLLQRDTAARESYRLRAAMDSTGSRIKSLEKELEEMKRLISRESKRIVESRSVMESARSASFNCVDESRNVKKMQRGSVSSLSTTFRRGGGGGSPLSQPQHRREKSFGKRLISGIKNAFSKQEGKKSEYGVEEIYDGLEDFVWIKDDDNVSEEFHSQYVKN